MDDQKYYIKLSKLGSKSNNLFFHDQSSFLMRPLKSYSKYFFENKEKKIKINFVKKTGIPIC